MGLKEYNEKRNFDKTKEPKGKVCKSQSGRFVVQRHRARADHYDFRLEYNGVLLSWAVPKGLSDNPKDKRLAVMVEDHPVDYIDFEGVIPKGNYGAGTVEIFDTGNYMPLKSMSKGLKTGHIKVVLNGEKLRGEYSLIKMQDKNWLVVKGDDGLVCSGGKSKKLPFTKCQVMLATLIGEVPKSRGYISEIKYDGYRIISFVQNGEVKLFSRNYTDYTQKFKVIAQALKKVEQQSFVADGEVVSFDGNGRSDFGLLQTNIRKKKEDFYYVAFDLLALNGEDLRELPLLKRKRKLESITYNVDERIIYSSHVENIKECLKFSKEKDLEGIVVKKANSVYSGGRSQDWLKIKNSRRQEFVIAGYSVTEKNHLIGALLLGYYFDGELIYVGKVGTGLGEKEKEELMRKFKKITVKKCPFKEKINSADITWLKPELVAEIKFTEFTKDGVLRQPSFVGLREDKSVKDVVLENSYGKDD